MLRQPITSSPTSSQLCRDGRHLRSSGPSPSDQSTPMGHDIAELRLLRDACVSDNVLDWSISPTDCAKASFATKAVTPDLLDTSRAAHARGFPHASRSALSRATLPVEHRLAAIDDWPPGTRSATFARHRHDGWLESWDELLGELAPARRAAMHAAEVSFSAQRPPHMSPGWHPRAPNLWTRNP